MSPDSKRAAVRPAFEEGAWTGGGARQGAPPRQNGRDELGTEGSVNPAAAGGVGIRPSDPTPWSGDQQLPEGVPICLA
jgi:hypothetical protein